jgi:hypothetical protein
MVNLKLPSNTQLRRQAPLLTTAGEFSLPPCQSKGNLAAISLPAKAPFWAVVGEEEDCFLLGKMLPFPTGKQTGPPLRVTASSAPGVLATPPQYI